MTRNLQALHYVKKRRKIYAFFVDHNTNHILKREFLIVLVSKMRSTFSISLSLGSRISRKGEERKGKENNENGME